MKTSPHSIKSMAAKSKVRGTFFMTPIAMFRIGLIVLFLFHAINNIIIVAADTTPFIADASDLYKHSVYYYRLITASIKSCNFQMLTPVFHMILCGQLVSIVTVPFYFLFGVSHDVAVMANLLFLLVLFLSVFGIGATLFNNTVGFLAAFIISLYPSIFAFSRVYMIDFAAVSITALSLFLLIKAQGSRNRAYSIYFGLAVGLGVLLRPRFIICIIVPVFCYFIKNLLEVYSQWENSGKPQVKSMLVRMFLSGLFCYLIIMPWYSFKNIREYFSFQETWSTLPSLLKAQTTFWDYAYSLCAIHVRWFFGLLFLYGAGSALSEYPKRTKIYFLLAWLVFSFILISSFGLKQHARLTLFLCVPIALISSAGLEKLAESKMGKIILFVLLASGVVHYLMISYGTNTCQNVISRVSVSEKKIRHDQYFAISDRSGLLHAYKNDWRIDQIIAVLNKQRNHDLRFSWKQINHNVNYLMRLKLGDDNFDERVKVLYIEFRGSPIGNEIEERILTQGLSISLIGLYPDDFEYKKLFSENELRCMVLGSDYVLVFRETPGGENRSTFLSQIRKIFDDNIAQFEELKTVETPWGNCVIYGETGSR